MFLIVRVQCKFCDFKIKMYIFPRGCIRWNKKTPYRLLKDLYSSHAVCYNLMSVFVLGKSTAVPSSSINRIKWKTAILSQFLEIYRYLEKHLYVCACISKQFTNTAQILHTKIQHALVDANTCRLEIYMPFEWLFWCTLIDTSNLLTLPMSVEFGSCTSWSSRYPWT